MKAMFRSTHTATTEAMFRSMYTDYCGGNVHILWRKCLYTITMETTFSVGSQRHCSSQHIWTSTRMMGWCGPPWCCLVSFHLLVLCGWGNDCVIDFLYLLPVTVLDDDCHHKYCKVLPSAVASLSIVDPRINLHYDKSLWIFEFVHVSKVTSL